MTYGNKYSGFKYKYKCNYPSLNYEYKYKFSTHASRTSTRTSTSNLYIRKNLEYNYKHQVLQVLSAASFENYDNQCTKTY